jgi:hypothetical protein
MPSRPSTALASPLAQPSIEAIWIAAAAQLGLRVERVDTSYASTDGRGTIAIGVDSVLDGDDALAQLVFHELCHGLVEGPSRWSQPDWGLSNVDARDVVREHACLRVQIQLTEAHGLRELMAPTTEYRAYHDAVAGDPLLPADDAAAALARQAIEREESRPWLAALDAALAATRAALDQPALRSPVMSATEAPALHPVGFAFGDGGDGDGRTCGSCAWMYRGGRGRPVERCRQSAGEDGNGRRTEGRFRACERWEPPVECQDCGACCREAYHSVTVSVRDPVVWKQPDLIERRGHRFEIRREGPRCAALSGDTAQKGSFCCAIYDDRPRACRDFEAGGRHCLVARRRVGLTA